jgi:hypothetical protein
LEDGLGELKVIVKVELRCCSGGEFVGAVIDER